MVKGVAYQRERQKAIRKALAKAQTLTGVKVRSLFKEKGEAADIARAAYKAELKPSGTALLAAGAVVAMGVAPLVAAAAMPSAAAASAKMAAIGVGAKGGLATAVAPAAALLPQVAKAVTPALAPAVANQVAERRNGIIINLSLRNIQRISKGLSIGFA